MLSVVMPNVVAPAAQCSKTFWPNLHYAGRFVTV